MVVAANLGDARESDTTPSARAGAGRAHAGAARSARLARRPSAPGALALWLALALLLFEWVSYHRRWTT